MGRLSMLMLLLVLNLIVVMRDGSSAGLGPRFVTVVDGRKCGVRGRGEVTLLVWVEMIMLLILLLEVSLLMLSLFLLLLQLSKDEGRRRGSTAARWTSRFSIVAEAGERVSTRGV